MSLFVLIHLKLSNKKGSRVCVHSDSTCVQSLLSKAGRQPFHRDAVGAACSMIHRVMTITPTFGGWTMTFYRLGRYLWKPRFCYNSTQNELIFWGGALKWVMPASSATLITAELGRIVAVSSSNQTTSAARLNWLIIQPTLDVKWKGCLSLLRHLKPTKQKEMWFSQGVVRDF